MSKELEQAMMRFNTEYHRLLESKEYVTGKKFLWYVNEAKAFHFKEILCRLRERTQHRKLIEEYGKDYSAITYNDFPLRVSADCEKTITVYTCITGNYELPKHPLLIPDNYCFVLFSDTIKDCNGWDVRPIPEEIKSKYDNSEINRYIKFHPSSLFDTDFSLYMDGNVQLVAGITSFFEKGESDAGIWMFDHPTRNCLFQEAEACLRIKKGNQIRLLEQINRYSKEGMPRNYGLKEATVILTDLRNKLANTLLDEWWTEYYLSSSKRDQLALPYIIWKRGMSVDQIGNLGKNIRCDMHFIITGH